MGGEPSADGGAKPHLICGRSHAPPGEGAPSFDSKAVKTHKGLLLSRVTEHAMLKKKKGGVLMGRVSMPQGKGSQMHNRREYEEIGKPIPDNIDGSKSSENIILIDKDIREAYREIFGEALEKYNSKQKRADRKIVDYLDHIQKSKNGEKPFYEDVVQWGSKDDFQTPQMRERAKEALVKYVEGFEERNPNLKLIGAYIHMDEASPHLHLDYVPVAYGYSRGLEIRNSLDKAMKQMGFQPENESRKNNATKLWKENERVVFGQVCRDLGLEVEPERKSERKSLTVDEYKEARDEMLGHLEKEADTARQAAQDARKELRAVQNKAEAAEERLRAAVAVSKGIQDVRQISPVRRTLTGKEVYRPKDLRSLKAAAELAKKAEWERDTAIRERDRAYEQVWSRDAVIDKLKEQVKDLQKQVDQLAPYKAFVDSIQQLRERFQAWLAIWQKQRQEKKERPKKREFER